MTHYFHLRLPTLCIGAACALTTLQSTSAQVSPPSAAPSSVTPAEPAAPATPATPSAPPAPAADGSIVPGDALLSGWVPETAADHFQTALWMLTRDNLPQVEVYLLGAAQRATTGQQRAELYNAVGAGSIVRLLGHGGLSDQSREFLKSLIDAAELQARDPGRLAELAGQIAAAEDGTTWRRLTRAILGGEDRAAGALVNELARTDAAEPRQRLRAALVALGDHAVGPCWAGLESDRPPLIADCVEVLGTLDHTIAAQLVAGLAVAGVTEPDVAQALERVLSRQGGLPDRWALAQLLEKSTLSLVAAPVAQREMFESSDDTTRPLDSATVWRWNSASGAVEPIETTSRLAALLTAARLADLWHDVSQGAPTARRAALILRLEIAQQRRGLIDPLDQDRPGSPSARARELGAHELAEMLAWSNQRGLIGASIALSHALGTLGDITALAGYDGQPSTLVQTLNQPDPRVQFAAAKAIVQLNPGESFAGASWWERTRQFLATAQGQRRAVVGHGRVGRAAEIGNQLRSLGWEVDVVESGPELRRQAGENADYQLVVLEPSTADPTLGHLIEQLEGDPRTARLPILIVVPDLESSPLARHAELLELTRRYHVIPEPNEPLDLVPALQRIARDIQGGMPSLDELRRVGEEARRWTVGTGSAAESG